MGRKSVKENKNIYQEAREELNLTRDQASELLEFISADRLDKIENEKSPIRPDEVLKMSQVYNRAELCNFYCSRECPIGQRYVPEVEPKELSQITLEMLALLNTLESKKNRLIEITVDGKINEDEENDFANIKAKLDEMSKTITSLSLWIDNHTTK